MKNLIWAYYSIVRQNLDNNYFFYDDGTVIRQYDRTMNDLNLEVEVDPSKISDTDKEKIMSKCKEECSEEDIEKIRNILNQ